MLNIFLISVSASLRPYLCICICTSVCSCISGYLCCESAWENTATTFGAVSPPRGPQRRYFQTLFLVIFCLCREAQINIVFIGFLWILNMIINLIGLHPSYLDYKYYIMWQITFLKKNNKMNQPKVIRAFNVTYVFRVPKAESSLISECSHAQFLFCIVDSFSINFKAKLS